MPVSYTHLDVYKRQDEGSPLLVKVFYGRASGDGCHMARIMTLRCTSLDHENPTSVTGVHVGRPFLERVNGWPVDFNGYVGVLFRNENNLQANSWQVDAYMKAFYYGFPWSRWVNTRIGMGFGISYSNHVPWTEVVSQERRERPTSKLLNYLDPTIDVNVGDIFRSESWKKTYFGLGISHRSGTVSYTHLTPSPTFVTNAPDSSGGAARMASGLPAGLLVRAIVIGPVSYTHLDVYKRQVLICARVRKSILPRLLCFRSFAIAALSTAPSASFTIRAALSSARA